MIGTRVTSATGRSLPTSPACDPPSLACEALSSPMQDSQQPIVVPHRAISGDTTFRVRSLTVVPQGEITARNPGPHEFERVGEILDRLRR